MGMDRSSGTIGAMNLMTLDLIYSGIPRIPSPGEEVVTNSLTLSLGGGPTAAAVTAARLGADVKLATSLGGDRISGIARDMLEEEGIEFAGFYAEGSGIPVNVTSVMTFAGRDRAFLSFFPDNNFFSDNEDALYGYLKDAGYCMASTPCVNLLRRLRANGCRIAYDVSWDDGLSLESLLPVLKYVYLFTPNDKEALKITGAGNAREAIEMLARHVEHPVVKLGADGALAMKDGAVVHLPPADFTPVDSTGAGDAFLGGVVYGLTRGWDIPRCVELGNYTGGKATTAIGCLTAKSSLAEFERMGGRV